MTSIPIYCYHHVVPPDIYNKIPKKDKYLYVTTTKFEEQIQILKNRNIKSLSSNEFIDMIINKKYYPNSVLITFDDGNEDQYTYAYPLLKKYDMKAVFFLITSRINTNLYLKSDQLNEMKDIIDYQCHTHQLHNMNRIIQSTDNEKYNDLVFCIAILKKYNRQDIKYYMFCYPYGSTGKYFRNILNKKLFQACFICGNKIYNTLKHNRFNIPRMVII